MTKLDFISALHKHLSALPKKEVDERLNFYLETIDDRIEEGLSEDEAVAAVGSLDEISAQIIAEISPVTKKEKPQRRLKAWEIVMIILGSPIWISLLIAACSVILSVYVSLWAVIISLWAVFGSLVVSAFGTIVGGCCLALGGFPAVGIALIAASLVCAGLSIFLFYGCKYASKAAVWLTKLPFQKQSAQKEEHQR